MTNPFFERPIVNSPYEYPRQHWELDETGQPTGQLIGRRRAAWLTPLRWLFADRSAPVAFSITYRAGTSSGLVSARRRARSWGCSIAEFSHGLHAMCRVVNPIALATSV